jgi:hypothetical protein
MKKFLLSVFTLVVLSATIASAQVNIATTQTPSASVDVTARVVAPLSITANNDLEFGLIAQGQNPTIAATDAAAAQFTISKSATDPITLTWTLPSTLAGPSSGTIAISYLGSYTTNAVTTATTFTPGGDANLDTAITAATSVVLKLGAALTTTSSTPVGDYTGEVTLSIVYNAL